MVSLATLTIASLLADTGRDKEPRTPTPSDAEVLVFLRL